MSTHASIVRGFVLSCLISTGATSCVRLDEGHCIVNGGDFACNDEERMCATEIEGFREPSDPGNGCVSIAKTREYFDDYLVHVQYGLPDTLWPRGEVEDDVDSMAGVLVRAAEDRGLDGECVVDREQVLELEPLWREVKAVRTFLERRDRVRVGSAALEGFQVEAIVGLDAAVNDWLAKCKELTERTSG